MYRATGRPTMHRFVLAMMALSCGVPIPPETDTGHLRSALLKREKIMWVGAHPDDEGMLAGVVLAKACAVEGADCTIVSFESGKYGDCKPASLLNHTCPCLHGATKCPERLGATRELELTAAAKVLHANAIVLRRDDKMGGEHEAETIKTLLALWAAERPAVVITHGTNGGYGHGAHIAVHKLVLKAWRSLPRDQRPELYFALDLTNRTVDDDVVTDTVWGFDKLNPRSGLGASSVWELVLKSLEQHHTQTAVDHLRWLGPDRHRSSLHRVTD
jgi:LmbE family N-acetylglucosaminyl deacetylase